MSLSSQKYEFGIQGSKRHRIPDPDPQYWLAGRGTSVVHLDPVDPKLNGLLDPDPGIGKGIIASTGAKTLDFVTVGPTGGSVGKPDDPHNQGRT